jgi:hypothetical protein
MRAQLVRGLVFVLGGTGFISVMVSLSRCNAAAAADDDADEIMKAISYSNVSNVYDRFCNSNSNGTPQNGSRVTLKKARSLRSRMLSVCVVVVDYTSG